MIKFRLSILLGGIVTLVSFFLIGLNFNNQSSSYIKNLISFNRRKVLRKYLLPYQTISIQENTISYLEEDNFQLLKLEKEKKESGTDIKIKESIQKLPDNKIIKKYKLISGFYAGINNFFPGTGFIDFHKNNIVVLSSRGLLAFRNEINNDKENFKQIQNNINEFINNEQFKKYRWFSIKDLLIYKDKIFVSYTEEIKDNCWNTSIIVGDLNYKKIQFKKLYSPKDCIHSQNNVDGEFNAHQSGGRIIAIDENNILLTKGEFRTRTLAQNTKSFNGKIININLLNKNYKILSMGHRNPQGLYFDKKNNFILETEHGPAGGDEINLIELDNENKNKIQNYGWPIASYGEHYGGKVKKNNKKYKKYPLHKSHSDYGFIEPLKSFVPSIGISEIVKTKNNTYVVSSLKDKSIYFFKLNKKREITNLKRVEIGERIRDLIYKDHNLYLFLEDTASLGVINLNKKS
ncbi:MAG: PQQ-dependent sugar dehydrogenase [Prochlorococcus marinus XMU1428]|nr:PQQ-dependent sugar dehydrogenase [Prochlorococcus marinus XMU1428]